MIWINFQYSPSPHELQTRSISKSLSLHQSTKGCKRKLSNHHWIKYDQRKLSNHHWIKYDHHISRIKETCHDYILYTKSTTNLSILADHPNLPETSTQGDELRRLETWTFATLSPSCCFIQSHKRLYSCCVSLSFTSSSSPGIRQSHKKDAQQNPKRYKS